MDLGDVGKRLNKAMKSDDPVEQTEYDYAASYNLRSKMLGVLIRDARLNAARTLEDCARLLGITPQTVEAWEYGDGVPTLPQLELLAYYLDVPVSHFWSQKTIDQDKSEKVTAQAEYMTLRNRMIGALLRQAREAAELSPEEVASTAHITLDAYQRYEVGEIPIPMSELTVLSGIVKKNMDYFLESSSYVGELLRIRQEWQHFIELEPDVREFAANPLNIGFIKIAMTFSQMNVEQLRKAAEGMLEIAM